MDSKKTSWGKVAEWYDEVITSDDSYQQQVIIPNLKRLVNAGSGDYILDLACGTGLFTEYFSNYAKVVGVDVGKELISVAQKKYPKLDFRITSADDLSLFKDKSFTKIIIVLAIQNISEVNAMLKECFRVLSVGGSVHIVMNHPMFRIPQKTSWQWDEEHGQQYRRVDGYLHESNTSIMMHPGKDQNNKTISFHRPLQYYCKLFTNTGFLIGRLEEWISHKVSQAGPRQKEEDRIRKEIPLFMYIELKKI